MEEDKSSSFQDPLLNVHCPQKTSHTDILFFTNVCLLLHFATRVCLHVTLEAVFFLPSCFFLDLLFQSKYCGADRALMSTTGADDESMEIMIRNPVGPPLLANAVSVAHYSLAKYRPEISYDCRLSFM